jgi:hypothetical protein
LESYGQTAAVYVKSFAWEDTLLTICFSLQQEKQVREISLEQTYNTLINMHIRTKDTKNKFSTQQILQSVFFPKQIKDRPFRIVGAKCNFVSTGENVNKCFNFRENPNDCFQIYSEICSDFVWDICIYLSQLSKIK